MIKKLIPLLLITTAFISCTPEDKGSAGNAEGGRKQPAVRAAAESGADNKSADNKQINFSEVSDPEGRDFLLYNESPEQRAFPRDFEIGTLQNKLESDESTEAILETAEKFLGTIVEGELGVEYIASEKRDFVTRNLEVEMSKADITDFRIGIINMEAEPILAAVRVISETGFAEGVMYFSRAETWKVQDFHIDFSETDKKENDNSEWFPYNKAM